MPSLEEDENDGNGEGVSELKVKGGSVEGIRHWAQRWQNGLQVEGVGQW